MIQAEIINSHSVVWLGNYLLRGICPDRPRPTPGTVSIAPRSDFVRHFGSAAVVVENRSDRPKLITNLTRTQFALYCISDSLISVDLQWRRPSIQFSRSNFQYEISLPVPVIISSLFIEEFIADIPPSLFHTIVYNMTQSGARRITSSNRQFTNCTRDRIVSNLEPINLIINQHTLVLSPEDYTHFPQDRPGICFVKFQPHTPLYPNAPASFNPVCIPGVNYRITPTELELCDPLD